VFSKLKRLEQVPSLVDMDVIDAIMDGSIEVVATVQSFDRDKVVLVDGSRLDPHAVVLATRYRRGLEPLIGHLGVLDVMGKPVTWGVRPAAAGLRFTGYDVRPSLIGYMAKQSKRMAKRIACELSAAQVLRLQHDVGNERLILAVGLVLDRVEQHALLLLHVFAVLR
jgi:hypothetical protein